ncbi:MAG: T9SS type A sorting domain-containing protein, partial [Bacteroidales bacterium]|nr:T9SS type A sorting domain-containing protein [Bacteroidales bacterium]
MTQTVKKTVFLLAFLAAFFLAPKGVGQVYFHDDFQNARLDNHASAEVDTVWTLYNDDNEPIADVSFFDKAWKIYGDAEGNRFAASPSYFKGSGKADRWMVTPAIALTDAQNPVLVFRAKSLDSKNRDNMEVRISTTDSLKASFSKTLQAISRAQTSWNYYTIDLSEYKGQKVFLAFVQNSSNKYLIGLDDVSVYEKRDNQMFMSAAAPVAVIAKSFPYTLSVKANVYNAGAKSVSSCTLSYSFDGGEKKNLTVSTGIEPGAAHEVSFEIPVNEHGYHTVNLSMENAPATQVSSLVALYTALPRQRLLWESFSSGMCSNCEPWNRFLHPVYVKLKTNVPDNSGDFVMAKYQVNIPAAGDPMVTPETDYVAGRAKYYNISGAPSFFMNGKMYKFRDYGTNDEEEFRGFLEKTLSDSIAAFRTRTSSIKLEGRLIREENSFRVETSIITCFPDPDNYELVVVLLEDSIHMTQPQHNGEKDFFSIVRKMMSPTSGLAVTPAQVGDSVKKSFSFVLDGKNPRIFNGLDGVNAVIYLQNARTRQIIQALYLKAGYSTANDKVEKTTMHFDLYPNPADEKVNLRFESNKNQSLDVRVFNLAGTQMHTFKWNVAAGMNHTEINTSAWQAGTYLVGIYSQEGIIV